MGIDIRVVLAFVVFMLFCAPAIVGIITYQIGSDNGYDKGYKQGQVDAFHGKLKYQLKIKIDTLYHETP